MPGWAGSSWYFLRYMDPTNENEFVAKDKVNYWQNVDLYIGGAEHATGHLLYSRFWTKFLYDLDYIPFEEPFKKMINQGMIQGNSALVYKLNLIVQFMPKEASSDKNAIIPKDLPNLFISYDLLKKSQEGDHSIRSLIDKKIQEINNEISKKNPNSKGRVLSPDTKYPIPLYSDINFLDGDKLCINKFENWRADYKNSKFITNENGDFIVGREIDKMSKSKYNVQTPDDLVEKYGADTLRCYEMFLGPLEQHKPWDVQGITGVHGFLKKLWRLFHDDNGINLSDETPTKEELKSLHKTIKKVTEDIERYSFNTPVSTFMICVNELTALKCNKKAILSELCIILSPFAPHIAEELWKKLGNTESITYAVFPKHNEEYLTEANHKYPVSFNGKMRFMLELPKTMSKDDIEGVVMANEQTAKYLNGKAPKKVIVVPNKIVNFVI
ncbi:MAG: class I tRNA ligase family protein, partial [Vicingaceae bacterium]